MGNGSSSSDPQSARPNARQPPAGSSDPQDYGHSTFTQKQRQGLQKRYQNYDRADKGIPLDITLGMPEFAGNKLISILIHDYLNEKTGNMHLPGFISLCNFLSPNTSPLDKKKALFESFNVYSTDIFTHDEIFRIYKTLLGHVVSDDHILALTFEALRHPSLENQGQMTKEEFMTLIPDHEIEEKLTVYFNV